MLNWDDYYEDHTALAQVATGSTAAATPAPAVVMAAIETENRLATEATSSAEPVIPEQPTHFLLSE